MKSMVSSNSITLLSLAKFNPFLQVGELNDHGYHELNLGFQFLDLADKMRFTLLKEKIVLDYSYSFKKSDDLCFKAIKLLQKTKNYQTQKKQNSFLGIQIELKKKIPFGSGLGGGSSNAASTLVALNHLWNLSLTKKELFSLGLKIGADVPFFIGGRASCATGVGENLKAYNFKECSYLLLYPGVVVSTKSVFNHPNLSRRRVFKNIEKSNYFNDCTELTLNLYPEVKEAYDYLSQFGEVIMSGTGSSLLIKLKLSLIKKISSQIRNNRKNAINSKNWILYSVKSLNKSPLNIKLLG